MSETVAQEEARQTLLDEIWQLKQKIEQVEGLKHEKEAEVVCCRAYNDDMEAKLKACQVGFFSISVLATFLGINYL